MNQSEMKHKLDKTACRTPSSGKDGVTHIPSWKYEVVEHAILKAMTHQNGKAISFPNLRSLAKDEMAEEALGKLGSWGWHFTTVKLNMEVEGQIERVKDSSPQQLVLKL